MTLPKLEKIPGISIKEAMEIAGKQGFKMSYPTMINWAITCHIGKKVGGRWYIDREKLMYLLKYGIK